MRLHWSFFAPLMLLCAGCGERMESICTSEIKSSLMNPETAEFHDFRTVKPSEYVDLLLAGSAKGQGTPVTPDAQARVEMAMHQINKQAPNSTYHAVRVRAEGQLGNKITSEMLCMAEKGKCSCSDPVADARNG